MATKKTTKQPAKRNQYIVLVSFDNHFGDNDTYHVGPFDTKKAARKAAADELTTILGYWDCLDGDEIKYDALEEHPFKGKTIDEVVNRIASSNKEEFEFITGRDDWCKASVSSL